MRSLRKHLAFSAISAACAFLSWPAHASTTTWDHNGSQVVLEENGNKRKLVYSEPRGPLDAAGVKRGTVLFDGEEKADGRLAGYAKLFRAGCDPVDYFVEGSFDKSKGEILLQGQAPIYSGQGCKITGYSDDNSASTLSFRQQGGGAYASRDVAPDQPGAATGNSSRYEPPLDPEPNRDDPAYDPADPGSADPRYDDRDAVDPRTDPRYSDRSDDPRTGHPRFIYRYSDGPRGYPSPGNDGYAARRPNHDDPNADDFEEEEPAYRPYRPYWRWGN